MRRIYLDHTATTPLDLRVLDAMVPFFGTVFGNASSIHSFGREAKSALEESRSSIATAIGAAPSELFFVSGGTESDNLAILGSWRAARKRGRESVIVGAAEHHAVLDTAGSLEDEGAVVRLAKTDNGGMTSSAAVSELVDSRTALVSVMHANNEVGTINPITEIASVAHTQGALMHSDAVQTLGKIPVNVDALGVDLLTVSAHKLYGPKGIGALYIRRGTEVEQIIHGGGQERGRRPGTENVALAVGFARALEIAEENRERERERLCSLRDALQQALTSRFPYLLVNGSSAGRLPHILNISVDSSVARVEGEMLVPTLDLEGIAVTSGSACTSGSMQPSHVLLAMGYDEATARATVRFSLGRGNTKEDIVETVERVSRVLERTVRMIQ
ncbi:MAG: cysteine desulfurase family protein [Bacteroidota bacterium]